METTTNEVAQVKSPYPVFHTKADRLTFFKKNLGENVPWAIRAMERIFAFQTANEQAAEVTEQNNGVGFTGTDAHILSSFCKQVQKNRALKLKGQFTFNCFLSPKQQAILLRKMPKYAGQLISQLETEGKAPPVVKAGNELALTA